VVLLFLNSIYYAKNSLVFWEYAAAFGTPGLDPIVVVLYSQIGMMCTFCGVSSTT
jgi:hypothetical protein